jgi:two-component system phosphate regulon sensor histidine kinase PhoR
LKLSRPSFIRKLIASYLVVVAVTLLIAGAYLTRRLKSNFLTDVEQSLSSQAMLMRDIAQPVISHPGTTDSLQQLAHHLGSQMGCRVTFIRSDGVVQGDSERTLGEMKRMDNHGTRPEVQAALASGSGQSMRYSHTLNEDMLYLAVPMRPWGVLRVALPLTEVRKRINSFQGDLLKTAAAALALALIVAYLVARKTIQPLNILAETARQMGEGRFPREVALASRDEFGQLARAFSDMSGRIEEKVQELSRERTQLAAILSALVEGVIAVDHDGRILFLNPAAELLFGVSSASIMGRPIVEVLRHSPLQGVIQDTLRERKSVSQEISIHSPQERTLMVHALPVSYGGAHTGVLAALHDITELRRLERVRQEFVANVSHELKTPLTAIKGYVETLLTGALEDKTHNRQFLEIIDDHARHLALLIDDVLDLSAIEAKRVEYRFEAVSLPEITERLIKGLAPMAQAKEVRILNGLKEGLPKVRADRDKLAQILMNLIDNAIKFNKKGGQVEITAKPAQNAVVVSIRDTGTGISAEDLPRVFERFYRADKARSHTIAGTGLGLAIVKHLVEAHQGTVTAESEPGIGSTFSFTLPLI